MKTLLLSLFILPFLSHSQNDVLNSDTLINEDNLYGNWKFVYIEAFDWSSYGIGSDSLEIDYFMTLSNEEYIEVMSPKDSGFVRTGEWIFNEKSKTIKIKVLNQKSYDSESDNNSKGMLIELDIIKLEANKMELIYKLPDHINYEFALEGLGLCKLIKHNNKL